ncbi:MAG: phosphatidylglycerophosphatase A [Thiogranum sp.]|nr:phosphatidylglycerophosphatase A [Thiogranum sp.]
MPGPRFRRVHIWKPWPIRAADRKMDGNVGIVLDNLLAGLAAAMI